MRWMNELSGDARSLLEKERELAREPEDRRNRVLARARCGARVVRSTAK